MGRRRAAPFRSFPVDDNLHRRRELAIRAAELFQQHIAEAGVRLVDSNRKHELLYMMEHIDLSVKEYRDDVVKGIITKVVILSADRIRITFDNNMEMEQDLPSE